MTYQKWNIHPGEVLREEFMNPMDLTSYRLAKLLHVPSPRINDIVLEKRGITADTALRLSQYFKTTVQFWMNLQSSFEIREAKKKLEEELSQIAPREDLGTNPE